MQLSFIPEMTWLVFGSLIFALIVFTTWRKTGNPLLLYAHVSFLFLPLFTFTFSVPCSMSWFTGLFQFCSIIWTKLAVYMIPFFIILSIIFGYVLLPVFYKYRLHAQAYSLLWLKKYAQMADIGNVHFYWFDTMTPKSFSIQNAIFMSQGMMELLSSKEIEAVILHELYHVQKCSGWKKFSTMLERFITPLAAFSTYHSHLAREESQADRFACSLQGTDKYIMLAKRKLEAYEHEIGRVDSILNS